MKNSNVMRIIELACVSLSLVSAVVGGAGKTPPDRADSAIAAVDITPDVIVWEPLVEFREVRLKVGAEAGLFEYRFEPGETIYFEIVGPDGTLLPDGPYSYELVASPLLSVIRDNREDETAQEVRRLLKDYPTAQSGTFTIDAGRVVLPSEEEGLSFRTVLTTLDGVIRNSLCVGFDCPTLPNFDDSTILMMEDNTRITFNDTSKAGGTFPDRDWQLRANDSANGGANVFYLVDCNVAGSQGTCAGSKPFVVKADSPENALAIDPNGVGFGTYFPQVSAHIVRDNSPTVRLEQSGAKGFAPQTWDIVGNEASFHVRDLTNGSQLPFRIVAKAPTNSIFVERTGDVGFGTDSPVLNGITVHGGDAGEAVVKLCHDGSGCSETADGANLALSGNDLFYTNREKGDLYFFTSNVQKMVLDDGNNHRIEGNLTVNGNLTATGAKPFLTPDPSDDSRLIRYVAMEGPEAALFVRGSVELVEGRARIELPDHFKALAVEKTITVSLTPRSEDSLGVAAVRVSSEQIDIKELFKGRGRYQVDYVVYAVRLGYEDFPVYLPKRP